MVTYQNQTRRKTNWQRGTVRGQSKKKRQPWEFLKANSNETANQREYRLTEASSSTYHWRNQAFLRPLRWKNNIGWKNKRQSIHLYLHKYQTGPVEQSRSKNWQRHPSIDGNQHKTRQNQANIIESSEIVKEVNKSIGRRIGAEECRANKSMPRILDNENCQQGGASNKYLNKGNRTVQRRAGGNNTQTTGPTSDSSGITTTTRAEISNKQQKTSARRNKKKKQMQTKTRKNIRRQKSS